MGKTISGYGMAISRKRWCPQTFSSTPDGAVLKERKLALSMTEYEKRQMRVMRVVIETESGTPALIFGKGRMGQHWKGKITITPVEPYPEVTSDGQ
jgi:hypothetical protein